MFRSSWFPFYAVQCFNMIVVIFVFVLFSMRPMFTRILRGGIASKVRTLSNITFLYIQHKRLELRNIILT